ncbi:MAG TPA: DUF4254 domain-containing protein [Ideonella sp.]|nr:DUF4254 domain-containing protein [Ideonella sp.]
MLEHFDAQRVVAFHDAHLAGPATARRAHRADQRLWHAIEANHLCNSLRWNEEDKARRRDVAPAEIARCKRLIDGYNQRRNDAVETIDELLLAALADLGPPKSGARLSSESAGMMIDRLSILALKIHHMAAQAARRDADTDHRARCRAKLAVLREQRADLAGCLTQLLHEVVQGTACFKVYRQYKMYNDPTLNPWLYRRGGVPVSAQPS